MPVFVKVRKMHNKNIQKISGQGNNITAARRIKI